MEQAQYRTGHGEREGGEDINNSMPLLGACRAPMPEEAYAAAVALTESLRTPDFSPNFAQSILT